MKDLSLSSDSQLDELFADSTCFVSSHTACHKKGITFDITKKTVPVEATQ